MSKKSAEMRLSENFRNKSKILLLLLLFLQTVSYVADQLSFATVNDQFIFGKLSNNVFSVVAATLFLIVLILIFVRVRKVFSFWLVLIISGSLSNIIDRLVYGGVIDYFNLSNLFVFNLSDLSIIIGLSGIAINSIRENKTPS